VGNAQEAVLPFGPDAVLNTVPGRTYCVLSVPEGNRAVASALDGSEQQACRFSSGQLESLGSAPGARLTLLLANNLPPEQLSRPLEDPHGLHNLVDSLLVVELIESPFFLADAVAGLVSPAALFESQQSIVEFSAKSRLSTPGARYEWYNEPELWCRLYDSSYSTSQPRLETEQCRFTSASLDAVRMRVGKGELRAGTYRL